MIYGLMGEKVITNTWTRKHLTVYPDVKTCEVFPWATQSCAIRLKALIQVRLKYPRGLYRSQKTWKVIKSKNFIFPAWRVMQFNCRSSWKVMKKWSYLIDRLSPVYDTITIIIKICNNIKNNEFFLKLIQYFVFTHYFTRTFTSRVAPKAILNSPRMSLENTLWKVCLKRAVLKESPITM